MYSTNLSRKPGCFHPHLMCPEAPTAFSLPFFFGQKTRAREPNETVKGGTAHEWNVEDARNGVV